MVFVQRTGLLLVLVSLSVSCRADFDWSFPFVNPFVPLKAFNFSSMFDWDSNSTEVISEQTGIQNLNGTATTARFACTGKNVTWTLNDQGPTEIAGLSVSQEGDQSVAELEWTALKEEEANMLCCAEQHGSVGDHSSAFVASKSCETVAKPEEPKE